MIILDTNVVSEMTRERPDPMVSAWLLRQADATLYYLSYGGGVSLRIGTDAEGRRRERLTEITHNVLEVEFRGRVLPFDDAAARHYAPILAARRKKGAPMSAFDAQIAAIAFANGASLATRNVMDFEGCGVNLIDPWKAKA